MKFSIHVATVAIIAAHTTSATAADAAGTRVLTPPPIQEAPQATFDKQMFLQRYEQEGRPAIAIFWNRHLSDALSQWQAYRRQVIDRRLTGRAASDDNNDESINDDYNCSFSLSSTGAGDCRYTESRFEEINVGTDAGLNDTEFTTPRDEFEFGAAFTQALLSSGITLVDRELVMRLVQRQNQQMPLAQSIPDYYEVELQALKGYAEYVAEVLLADPVAVDDDPSFMVSIKEIDSGRVVGMFSVDGNNQNSDLLDMKWEPGPGGYERVPDITQSQDKIETIGQEVGERTMQALDAYWSTAH